MDQTPEIPRIYLQNPDVVVREVDEDGALLFNPDTNRVRVINRTGFFIWSSCEKGADLPSLVSGLKETFDQVPEVEALDQVEAYISDLVKSGFIGLAGAGGPAAEAARTW